MAKSQILIIEDDPDILELLQYNLEREGFEVLVAEDGETGLREAATRRPSLILLDLMLPGMAGLDVCRQLQRQEETSRIPVVMVTAKGEESDVVLGLELGADDYITKPFGVRELVARVRSVLRRAEANRPPAVEGRIEQGPIVIDQSRHEVLLDGELVELTLAEFRLLRALAANPGRVLTRDQLISRITAGGYQIAERNVDVHVAAVRRKMKKIADLIVTVRGVGYKLRD
ncbi:MAG: response regulator [Acidobacteriota bacterium]